MNTTTFMVMGSFDDLIYFNLVYTPICIVTGSCFIPLTYLPTRSRKGHRLHSQLGPIPFSFPLLFPLLILTRNKRADLKGKHTKKQ